MGLHFGGRSTGHGLGLVEIIERCLRFLLTGWPFSIPLTVLHMIFLRFGCSFFCGSSFGFRSNFHVSCVLLWLLFFLVNCLLLLLRLRRRILSSCHLDFDVTLLLLRLLLAASLRSLGIVQSVLHLHLGLLGADFKEGIDQAVGGEEVRDLCGRRVIVGQLVVEDQMQGLFQLSVQEIVPAVLLEVLQKQAEVLSRADTVIGS